MRLLLDENLSSRGLAALLIAAGHDVVTSGDAGLDGQPDPRVLIEAVRDGRSVLTRNADDFTDLHDLVMAVGGHHSGILLIQFDDNFRHNLSNRAIVAAIGRLLASGPPIADELHTLNQWK